MSSEKRLLSPIKLESANEEKKIKLINNDNVTEFKHSANEKENYDFLFEDDDAFLEALATVSSSSNEIPVKVKQEQELQLDLSTWQRCVVLEIEREPITYDLVLKVQGQDVELQKSTPAAVAKCHLQGPWSQIQVAVKDVVSLQAVWNKDKNAYVVGRDHGYCVTNPDTLISGTIVVGSLFCRRKAVLQDRFRGIDSNSKVMVVGSLVHEMLQIVLETRAKTYAEVKDVLHDLLNSTQVAYMLYESQLTREDVLLGLRKFVPNIVAFVSQYIEGKEPAVVLPEVFQGRITEIKDIEENLWVPQLGLKGRVDVSVRIHRRRRGNNLGFQPTGAQHAIPLELKTGRATFSMEHKGQLMLYQMMSKVIGRDIDSGLLLYLREGIMREVHSTRNEQRDLIVLRNELAHYLTQSPQLPCELDEDQSVTPFELPEPISHHIACNSCPYATICCMFCTTEPTLELHENHPLRKVMQESLKHLILERDTNYFMHWCALLALEDAETRNSSHLRALWTETAESRQQQARAVCGLRLCCGTTPATDAAVLRQDSRFLHTLQVADTDPKDLTLSGFVVGEYVIISSAKHLAIATGYINDLKRHSVTISLERDLRQNYATEQSFIMDKHASQSFSVFNYTNLGLLIENTPRAAQLRDIVIAQKPPTYATALPKLIATAGKVVLRDLNSVQVQAVIKALTTDSYMLIKGLPGTGKTQTLVVIVRLLQLMGKTVLITSQTHSAVDNLMLRLLPLKLPMLRLGPTSRVHAELQHCSEDELLRNCHTELELAAQYAAFGIVGSTCLGMSHSIFKHRQFDFCIVDEATQIMQPSALRPLFFSPKFILVGDPDQLPPVIRSREARQRGADISLFAHLDSAAATAVLTLQYRMNETITKLANKLTYNGALKCATADVQLATMHLKQPPATDQEKWLQRACQTHIDQSVMLLDTLDCAERSYAFASTRHSQTCAFIEQTYAEEPAAPCATAHKPLRRRIAKYTNYCDAAVVFRLVRQLLAAELVAERIGVIAPYRAQVELLRKLATQYAALYPALDFASVEINTVDQYQGRDKDIIIYSGTKTGQVDCADMERSRESEVLGDQRRLTVAITRAKHKLIIVGDVNCLRQYTPFRQLFEYVPAQCRLQLHDEKLDFSWQTLLDELVTVINH